MNKDIVWVDDVATVHVSDWGGKYFQIETRDGSEDIGPLLQLNAEHFEVGSKIIIREPLA